MYGFPELENHIALGDFEPVRITERTISPHSAWLMLDTKTQREYWLDEMTYDWPEDPDKSWAHALMECKAEDFPKIRLEMQTRIIRHLHDNRHELFDRLMNRGFGTENTTWSLDR